MKDAPLIDTHIWIWWIEGASDLRRADRDALDQLPGDRRPRLSPISLWELSVLVQKRRYIPGREMGEWLRLAAGPATVRLEPINLLVANALVTIPESFHSDPADRIIVATAAAANLPVLTYDDRIRKSGLVKLWK